ncbi:MAG: hypothetical protein II495_04055, partial [Paludibacteraceae bacterium]|nr:hypothetical protein [Paludibacteraceae bacterium]
KFFAQNATKKKELTFNKHTSNHSKLIFLAPTAKHHHRKIRAEEDQAVSFFATQLHMAAY